MAQRLAVLFTNNPDFEQATMQLKFFTIPIHHNQQAVAELNQFLAQQRIVSVDRALVADGANSAWAICVAHEPAGDGSAVPAAPAMKKGKIDYREVLAEADFRVYAELRELRKKFAEQQGIPTYAVFKNDQMAQMVTRRVTTLAGLMALHGVGEGRVEKFGEAFLAILRRHFAGGGQADGQAPQGQSSET